MSAAVRRAPGMLEAEIMAVLWAGQAPMSVASVQATLGGGLAYNTVQTILIRLHTKGHVRRRRVGRGHAYWPVEAAAGRTQVCHARP